MLSDGLSDTKEIDHRAVARQMVRMKGSPSCFEFCAEFDEAVLQPNDGMANVSAGKLNGMVVVDEVELEAESLRVAPKKKEKRMLETSWKSKVPY